MLYGSVYTKCSGRQEASQGWPGAGAGPEGNVQNRFLVTPAQLTKKPRSGTLKTGERHAMCEMSFDRARDLGAGRFGTPRVGAALHGWASSPPP